MELYLVTYVRHNAETDKDAYKVEFATSNLSEAKKKYHALCGEFFDNDTFSFASVFITDAFGHKIEADYDGTVAPIVTE